MSHSLQSSSGNAATLGASVSFTPHAAMVATLVVYGIASTGWGSPYGAVAALLLLFGFGAYWWFHLQPVAFIINRSLAFSVFTILLPVLICFVFYSRSAALLALAAALGAWLMNRIQMVMYTGAWQTAVETRSPMKRAFRLVVLALTDFGVVGVLAVTGLVGGVSNGFAELRDAKRGWSLTESVPTVKNPIDAWRAGNAMIGPGGHLRDTKAGSPATGPTATSTAAPKPPKQ